MQFTVNNNSLIPADRTAEIWLNKQQGQVELKPVSKARRRSLDANAKYWQWCHTIEQEMGWDAGESHRYNKWFFALPILTRDYPDKRESLLSMLRKLEYEKRLQAMDLIACTSMFTVSEMQEFMDTVQRKWAEQGIELK
jgi:hypothetical protein